NLAVGPVQVQQRVERVVVHLALGGGIAAGDRLGIGQSCCHGPCIPSRTFCTSSVVPRSSNLYRWGTPHLRAMMSPAMQYAAPKLVFPAETTPRSCERLRSSLRNLM